MTLDQLEEKSPLRMFGEEIMTYIEKLGATIEPPPYPSGIHMVRRGGKHFLSFRFAGRMARTFPKNSIVFYTPWDDSFSNIPAVRKGNKTWHDRPSAELGVQPKSEKNARQYISLAFKLASD